MIEILWLAFNQANQGIFNFCLLIGLPSKWPARFKVSGKKFPRYLPGHQVDGELDIRVATADQGKVHVDIRGYRPRALGKPIEML